MKRTKAEPGFTLIELMVVVAVIGILGAVALPKFAALLTKSQQGSTRGNLGSMRSALSIYYGDNTFYPGGDLSTNSTVLSDALIPKYLDKIPTARYGGQHTDSANVYAQSTIAGGNTPDGDAGWVYDSNPSGFVTDGDWGTVWVSCSHTDMKGSNWTTY